MEIIHDLSLFLSLSIFFGLIVGEYARQNNVPLMSIS